MELAMTFRTALPPDVYAMDDGFTDGYRYGYQKLL
jgi:hypothetical protein